MKQKTFSNFQIQNFDDNAFPNEDVFSKITNDSKIIAAVGKPKYFCVGIVDIVDSTKTVDQLSPNQVPKYYEIFLNNMAKVVSNHGEILKIMGDSLLFYFKDTCDAQDTLAFQNAIECGFSMIKMHKKLNDILKRYMLPCIDFRISFDYGKVTVMETRTGLIDLVGPTINTCAKINDLSLRNNMVIGRDMYDKVRNLNQFQFKHANNFLIRSAHSYPVFSVSKKKFIPN